LEPRARLLSGVLMDHALDRTPVVWAATSPDSGRVALGRPGSTWVELSERITTLRSAGAGYVEAWLPELDYPYLAIGFQADYAVVHLFASAERVLLLGSDGTACSDEPIEVPILDETGIFTADFAIDTDRAFRAWVRSDERRGSADRGWQHHRRGRERVRRDLR
jgi:hypothetical protein